ncbi:MAG: hypothetical protein KF856_05490 [Cyclobacteriaceae bacterium]|nr:hypothetical protein [Cyclobacteriaceae bacterium]
MNSDKPGKDKTIDADQEQRAIDKLEEMWDRELAKGDDEFFESTDRYRATESKDNEQQEEQQPRRKGRRM